MNQSLYHSRMSGMIHMELDPLTPTIGAVVRGVELRHLPDNRALFDQVHEQWLRHLVLFFPDQTLSPEEHLALGECFGPLHVHPAAPYVGDNPALMKIHTDQESHRNNGDVWHSDVSADEEPPMASILYLKQVPSRGGDTLWANMYSVYESLSPAMQNFLPGLTAVHSADYTGFYGEHEPQRRSPKAIHPVVRTHPETGRRALFVNSGFTQRIVELEADESKSLLNFLFSKVKEPVFHCRFRWPANTVAIWDNRCTQHYALWDYFPEPRSGVRVTVAGDRPHLQ